MIEREGGVGRVEAREGGERELRAVGRLYIDIFERIRILLELRIDFQNHVILVKLRKNGRDLALAKGIVKRVVNVGKKNAKARGGIAVDGKRSEETLVQLIAGDVAKFGERF